MRLKKEKKIKRKGQTVKMTDEEKNKSQQKANLYCDGNLSEWMRYAAIYCVPNRKHLDK
jgi:hypothetical protein